VPSASKEVVIGIDGLGYMGLATGLGFAAKGWPVVGYDIKPELRRALAAGQSPFHEAGFPAQVHAQVRKGRLRVVDSAADLARETDGVFLCLPTPRGEDGQIDLTAIKAGSTALGQGLRSVSKYRVVVVKSTVVPGTTSEVIEPLLRKVTGKDPSRLGVAANPEFLAEGSAIRDATRPERIVMGASDKKAALWLRKVYAPFSAPIFELSPSEAELVKYAANTFLAIKVSFANEMSRLTEILGGNIDNVMQAVGKDSRIGQKFLRAGPGFGGSCFEKDVRALLARAGELGVKMRLGEAALRTNEEQAAHVVDLIRKSVGRLNGKRIAFLGVSFKAGTDDVRESRAFPIIRALVDEGAEVRVHDPVALENFQKEWGKFKLEHTEKVRFLESVQETLDASDLAVLQSDWAEYLSWPKSWTQLMERKSVLDLRRRLNNASAKRSGIRVVCLGIGDSQSTENRHEVFQ
jgi:UDPglucose 6-dehydrogenase